MPKVSRATLPGLSQTPETPDPARSELAATGAGPHETQKLTATASTPGGTAQARLQEMYPPRRGSAFASPSAPAPTPDQAAQSITALMRTSLAASAYHRMFSQGSHFKPLKYEPREQPWHPEALKQLETLSSSNLTRVKTKLGPLSAPEKKLLAAVIDSPWHFRHQSNGPVVNSSAKPGESDYVNILSHHGLDRQKIFRGSSTVLDDIEATANNDFVFFGLELTDSFKTGKVRSTTHSSLVYGQEAYLLPGTDTRVQHGYLTLSDHQCPGFSSEVIAPEMAQWRFWHKPMIWSAAKDIVRQDVADPVTQKSQMFSAADMKLGLGLSLIQFLRETNATSFKKWVYRNATENSKALHRSVNLVFQPEFHLPKIWSSRNFSQVNVGKASLGELLRAANYKKLDKQPLDRIECARVLLDNIWRNQLPSVSYLLGRIKFTAEDFALATQNRSETPLQTPAEALLESPDTSAAMVLLLTRKRMIDPHALLELLTSTPDHSRPYVRNDALRDMLLTVLELRKVTAGSKPVAV